MKNKILFSAFCLLLSTLVSLGQTTTHIYDSLDFESGSISPTWTINTGASYLIVTNVHAPSSGTNGKALQLKPNTASADTLTSPIYNVSQGQWARLEFSHIPMIANSSNGVAVFIRYQNTSGAWSNPVKLDAPNATLTADCYDASYGINVGCANNFSVGNTFFASCYYDVDITTPVPSVSDNSMWKHEIFNLTSYRLTNEAIAFQLMFIVPKAPNATIAAWAGWFLDDIRVYLGGMIGPTGQAIRVPQITALNTIPPDGVYPNCSANKIKVTVTNADTVYVIRRVGSTTDTLPLERAGNVYSGNIPFIGFNQDIYWRLEAKDVRGNIVRYPYQYKEFKRFRNVRGYVGSSQYADTLLSSDNFCAVSGVRQRAIQMRYSAADLLARGYSIGNIKDISFRVTDLPTSGVTTLTNLKIEMALCSQSYTTGTKLYVGGNLVADYPSFTVNMKNWVKIRLAQPFIWDGTSDIIVKIYCDAVTPLTSFVKAQYYTKPALATNYRTQIIDNSLTNVDIYTQSNLLSFTSTINKQPNIIFNFVDCLFDVDAAMSYKLATPATALNISNLYQVNSVIPTTFAGFVRNDGIETLPLGQTKYVFKHTSTTAFGTPSIFNNWTTAVNPIDTTVTLEGDTLFYAVDSVVQTAALTFPSEGYYYLKIWSEILPPSIDWNQSNDTAYFEVVSCNGTMSGIYSIGTSAGPVKSFKTFTEAFRMLKICGIGGPVTFNIDNTGNYYAEELDFPAYTEVAGLSATNNITFKSTTTSPIRMMADVANDESYNLDNCKYIKFENIDFQSAKKYTSEDKYVFSMNANTSDIEFKKCRFRKLPVAASPEDTLILTNKPTAMINIGAANNIIIDSCSFLYPAETDILIQGYSETNLSSGITVRNCTFENGQIIYDQQTHPLDTVTTNKAINANFTSNLNIINNKFKTPILPASINSLTYTVSVASSKNINITKNEFDLQNVSALAVSDVLNSDTVSVIANNEIGVYNHTGGTLELITGCLEYKSGYNTLIAHNNIYAKDDISNIHYTNAFSLGTDVTSNSTVVSNVRFMNNVVISDGAGYAVALLTNDLATYEFANNIYYKSSYPVYDPPIEDSNLLFSYGSVIMSVDEWIAYVHEDSSYYSRNPFFVGWNDLTTTNPFLCNKGAIIPNITDDFNNVTRPTPPARPTIGAHEYAPVSIDIFAQEVYIDGKGLYSVAGDTNVWTACDFANDTLTMKYINTGDVTVPTNQLILRYRIHNGTTWSSVVSRTVAHTIVPGVTYTEKFAQGYNFANIVPASVKQYTVQAYISLNTDGFHYNDTTYTYIIAKGQDAAPTAQNITIPYGQTVNLNVTSSLTDTVYWFLNRNDQDYVHRGRTYQTGRLSSDTIFYFSAKEEHPNIRISEIQITTSDNPRGITSPMPMYVTTPNAFEITNFGNGDVDLQGYKLRCYYTTAANDTMKTYKGFEFPSYVLPSNSSVVLLPINTSNQSSLPDGALAIGTGWNLNTTQKIGFILRKPTYDSAIIDAVAINGGIFMNSLNISSTVWRKSMLQISADSLESASAGISRVNLSGSDSSAWRVATDTARMTIGYYDDNLTTDVDNGCYGYKTPFTVHISPLPARDPSLVGITVLDDFENGDTACNLGMRQVQVEIKNNGTASITNAIPLVCKLYNGSTLVGNVSESYTGGIPSGQTRTFTFTTPLNFSTTTTKTYQVTAFIDGYINGSTPDTNRWNDTLSMNITALATPNTPVVTTNTVSVPYGTSTTLTATSTTGSSTVWYDDVLQTTPLSVGSYVTPEIYESDTFYVSSIGNTIDTIIIGDGIEYNDTVSAPYPSPFNAQIKNVKEQYLIKSYELAAEGITASTINSIMFEIFHTRGATTLNNYTIKIGHLPASYQNQLTTWIPDANLQQVYSGTVSLTNNQSGWKAIALSPSFVYDGVSDIVVQICFTATTASTMPKVRTKYTRTSYTSAVSYQNSTTDACSWTGSPGLTSNKRPNMKFGVLKAANCESNRVMVVVNPTTVTCDAALDSVSDSYVASGVPTAMSVKLKNYGTTNLTALDINWTLGGGTVNTIPWTGNLTIGGTSIIPIVTHTFNPGEVTEFKVWLSNLACDTLQANDTITQNVIACRGNEDSIIYYTINQSLPSSSTNYTSFSSAINELVEKGVCGTVIFDVANDVYNESIDIPSIRGTSPSSYVLFRGESKDSTVLSVNSGTVIKFFNTNNVRFSNMTVNNPSANNPNVVEIKQSDSVFMNNMIIASPSATALNLETANLVKLSKNNSYVMLDSISFMRGANAVYANLSSADSIRNITIRNSKFINFANNGITLNNVNRAAINHNDFNTTVAVSASIAVNAIKMINSKGVINISANKITLKGMSGSGIKTGILLRKLSSTLLNPIYVANNAVAIFGDPTLQNNYAYVGIDVDTVESINIFYNTVRVLMSKNATNSKCLYVGSGDNIKIQNNNLDNPGKGYVYYVKNTNANSFFSDYNNYRGTLASGAIKFAYWNADVPNLIDLRGNGRDAHSDTAFNPFISDTNLMLYYPNSTVRSANVVNAIKIDLTDNIRDFEKPTIGAYEYNLPSFDQGITSADINRGIILTTVTDEDSIIYYSVGDPLIENEPVYVIARIGNFGKSTLDSVQVTAQLAYDSLFINIIDSVTETNYHPISPVKTYDFTLEKEFLPPLGLNQNSKPLYWRVFTTNEPRDVMPINDTSAIPKELTVSTTVGGSNVLHGGSGSGSADTIRPRYDIEPISIDLTDHILGRCDLRNDTIIVSIRNNGARSITQENSVGWVMAYQVEGRDPVFDTVQWPIGTSYSIGSTETVQYTFKKPINLYPTDTVYTKAIPFYGTMVNDTLFRDTVYKIRVWSRLPEDNVIANDTSGHNSTLTTTSSWTNVTSLADPVRPYPYNDTIHFGTWGHPHATQDASLVIRWFKVDHCDTNYEFNKKSTYLLSQNFTTLRMFRDTTFFLMSNRTGTYKCTSKFSPISVIIKPREPIDLSLEQIIEPYYVDTTYTTTSSWVYMTEHDTVKVRVANYGTDTAREAYFWYSIKPTPPSNSAEEITGPALFIGTIPPYDTTQNTPTSRNYYTFKFPYHFPVDTINDMSADFSNVTKTYMIKAWLNSIDDYVRVNDTLADSVGNTAIFAKIKPKNGLTVYPSAAADSANSMDISRVQLGVLNNYSVPIGNTYTDYTQTADTAILYKTINDNLSVTVDLSTSMDLDTTLEGWVKAYIDWNRDGVFSTDELVMSKKAKVGTTVTTEINTSPEVNRNIINGYTRMRVILWEGVTSAPDEGAAIVKGEVEDYLVQIRTIEQYNAALYNFVTPLEFNDKARENVQVVLRNVGAQPLAAGTQIVWSNNGGLTWKPPYTLTSPLLKGEWDTVMIAEEISIDTGLTNFVAYVNAPNDTIHYNDTIELMSFLFRQPTVYYGNNMDNSDVDKDFYIWEPNFKYPSNCWQIGQLVADSNVYIKTPYSEPNVLKTNLSGKHPKNNVSVIYTPIFNISIVKPDTLSFMLRRYITAGTFLRVEYKSRSDRDWRVLGGMNDGYGVTWYNNISGFSTLTSRDWLPVKYSIKHLVDNGSISNTNVQFRFVFRSANGNNVDGFAIDNFELNRALLPIDAGAVAIELDPQLPNYGEYIKPKVWVKNFGSSTLQTFTLSYLAPDLRLGTGLPMVIVKDSVFTDVNLAPGDSALFIFGDDKKVYVGSETPARFNIYAWATSPNEPVAYRDNDTATLLAIIAPLLKDAGLTQLVYPTNSVATDDNVYVQIKVKNYGVLNLSTVPVAYKLSNGTVQRDTLKLNIPLRYGEEREFTFNQRFTAITGIVDLKVWVELDGDLYHENDTLVIRITSYPNMNDLAADRVVLDDSDPSKIGVQVDFTNRSASPISNIKVGYYVNGDISTAVVENYRSGGRILGASSSSHYFTKTLARNTYSSICGFVHISNDIDDGNDTICDRYIGYKDASADSVIIERTDDDSCRVQVWATNRGTLGGSNTVVTYHVLVDGTFYAQDVTQRWSVDAPNNSVGKILNFKIPKKPSGATYDIKAWIKYPNDINASNDTTTNYHIAGYVDLENPDKTENIFTLEQNVPNPFDDVTDIDFNLPYSGDVKFYIANNEGQQVYNVKLSYLAGRHTLKLKDLKLPQGVYFYTMEFDGKKLTRKMLLVK
ncbi:MAG: GEVED domain-containing protein [Bacteroidales bacterium]|jgi:hypothetical protein|nr:GEVED domain-containing protein [Bacteroidales bacterium]